MSDKIIRIKSHAAFAWYVVKTYGVTVDVIAAILCISDLGKNRTVDITEPGNAPEGHTDLMDGLVDALGAHMFADALGANVETVKAIVMHVIHNQKHIFAEFKDEMLDKITNDDTSFIGLLKKAMNPS